MLREITDQEIKDALRSPSDFGYSGENAAMFRTWSLGPVLRTRDSGLRDQSNADTIEKALTARTEFDGQWEIVTCNHWACDWVDHLSFRALDDEGNPTAVFRLIAEIYDAISEYPVLDEEDYSRREYNATIENITHEGRDLVADDAPDSWPNDALSWFRDNDPSAIESRDDDQGGCPDDNAMAECLAALGILFVYAEE